eukprot:gnl/TRDRNA2_/TRDRNA2_34837_c0_seq1.p1 gnl/TRDRNA2_/TRDRNA2_34837_c0~~gnl/TRDRNA2_/TRDRNA2_34837_c0_seq1.p1  ORF type:complete len:398 (+),score=23.91 gnl/TRDRNA2_/TRDRNA2_34837_c0_seq1:136-1194(+)
MASKTTSAFTPKSALRNSFALRDHTRAWQGLARRPADAIKLKASNMPVSGLTRDQKLRRMAYDMLVNLDKGDFRWEFLVPWLEENRTLTPTEKSIVYATFVTTAMVLQGVIDFEGNIFYHFSYLAQFFSFVVANPLGYRVINIAISIFEITGEVLSVDLDAIPVGYNSVFLIINLYYLLRWVVNNQELVLTAEEEDLFEFCFEKLGVKKNMYSRLLRTATWVTAQNDTTFCVEGEELYDLFVVVDGSVDAIVGGTVTAQIPPYQIIGEASLLENLQSPDGLAHLRARATIVARRNVRYVRWRQRDFYELKDLDQEFATMITLMIARTLSDKLRLARIDQQAMRTSLADSTYD